MNYALLALAVGAFGIGTSEFVIMGLLLEISRDLHTSLFWTGMLITGYALGVVFGSPVLSLLSAQLPPKRMLLILMAIFSLGNFICGIAPDYSLLMTARVITSLAHGAFFGIGSYVATSVVPENKKASAIAIMFTGLTVANVLGIPFGTWLGQTYDWRLTFKVVALIGPLAMLAIAMFVPNVQQNQKFSITDEIKGVANGDTFKGLLLTVLGFAGVFGVMTYIAPFLTKISGFSESVISPLLMLIGVGLIIGNIIGGKLADKQLKQSLVITVIALGLALLLLSFVSRLPYLNVAAVALFGVAGFATVPPLQLNVMRSAQKAPILAAVLNISAFNLGNAIGAWVGGLIVESSFGLFYVPAFSAIFSVLALAIIIWPASSTSTLQVVNQESTHGV